MSRRPPRRRQKSPKYNPYAGPSTCLRCDRKFWSWDRRQNRLCSACREAIAAEPSDEPPPPLSLHRFRHMDEG
jgi:hypothetical protein